MPSIRRLPRRCPSERVANPTRPTAHLAVAGCGDDDEVIKERDQAGFGGAWRRARRWRRVSGPAVAARGARGRFSGRGSDVGSRWRAGWSSTPVLWQTMQQNAEPGMITLPWGQASLGVKLKTGNSGSRWGSAIRS
jgi:hypothetical protein